MVTAWYPTDDDTGNKAFYMPQPWLGVAEKDQSGFGEILTHKLTNVQTNSYSDASLSNSKKVYPMVIFEPGLGRASYDYSYIAEDLASHGYIVLSSTPTYIADMVVFSKGDIALASSAAQLPENSDALTKDTLTKTELIRDVYAGDIAYLLTQVERLNMTLGNAWVGRVDTSRIGVMGHSLGGAAAYHVCLTDNRCKVALDIDGTLFGEQDSVNKVPFMFLSSDTSNDTGAGVKQEDDYNQAILDKQVSPFYQVTIHGAEHFNFSDLALRSPLIRYLGALGTIDRQTGIEVSRQYIVAMFDKYFENTKPAFLNSNYAIVGSTVVQR